MTDIPAHKLAVLHRDAAGLVNEDPEMASFSTAGQFQIDQLQTHGIKYGKHDLPNPIHVRLSVLSHPKPRQMKKVGGTAPTFTSFFISHPK
jgi:hypothetical protein